MNFAILSDEMISVLRSMIGKTFKSYECKKIKDELVYGKLRINLGTFSIDLFNYTKPIFYFEELEPEDISCFSCELAEKNQEFEPCEEGEIAHQYMIDERIKAVEIIRDKISINKEKYEIIMDQTIVITTQYNKYIFYRDWIFGETIKIKVEKEKIEYPSIDEVKSDWNNERETVNIERKIIAL